MTCPQERLRTDPELDNQISGLFADYTNAISQFAVSNRLVVVTGPFGIGKSTYLIPDVRDTISSLGVSATAVDVQKYSNIVGRAGECILNETNAKEGVIILDEAGAIAEGKADTQKTLDTLLTNGLNVVALIAYPAHRSDLAFKAKGAWKAAIKGEQVTEIDIPPIRLSESLALQLMASTIARNPEGVYDQEKIRYVLDTVPYNLRVLVMCASMINIWRGDLREFMTDISMNCEIWRGAITPDEIERIRTKTFNDLHPQYEG